MDEESRGQGLAGRLSRLGRSLLTHRAQLFLEVGFGRGEIAAYLKTADGHRSGLLHGSLFDSVLVRRRVIGWLASRVLRGLAVVLPRAGWADAELGLLQVLAKARQAGCPCLAVVPLSSASRRVEEIREVLGGDAAVRQVRVSPCAYQWTPNPAHEILDVFGFGCGFGFDDEQTCRHGPGARPASSARPVVLGSILGEKLALWLRGGTDRLEQARLFSLVT